MGQQTVLPLSFIKKKGGDEKKGKTTGSISLQKQ